MADQSLFRGYRDYLKKRFPEFEKVRKFALNGGFTCPNRDGSKGTGGCIYCDNRSFSQALLRGRDAIRKQILEHFSRAKKKEGLGWVAYFQPFSNTYAPVSQLREMYLEALETPGVEGLNIGTRPDCVGAEVVELLDELSKKYKITLELGLESGHDSTLEWMNRKHTVEEFEDAMNRCSGRDFDLCVHVMIGLPGESSKQIKETALMLNRWKVDLVKIHPVHVVPGTGLEEMWKKGEYTFLKREDYVNWTADFIERTADTCTIERFSAVVNDEYLVGPHWIGKVNELRNAIEAELGRRGSYQGKQIAL